MLCFLVLVGRNEMGRVIIISIVLRDIGFEFFFADVGVLGFFLGFSKVGSFFVVVVYYSFFYYLCF